MHSKMELAPIFIDATPLLSKSLSGVGKTVHRLLRAIPRVDIVSRRICLMVPKGMSGCIDKELSSLYEVKEYPIPYNLFRAAKKYNLLPPLDSFLGKGLYIFMNYWNTPLSKGSRSITVVYDMSYVFARESLNKKNLKYLSRNMKSWVMRSDTVATISNQVKSEIAGVFPGFKGGIEIMKLGVDKDLYKVAEQDLLGVLDKYGLSYGDYFLVVGNLEPRKNTDKVIKAFLQSGVNRDGVRLVLVGADGWGNETVLQLVEQNLENGVVRLPSTVTDNELACLYAGAVRTILYSSYEGFGLSPLESLASGTPAIVSDIEVFREIYGGLAEFAPPDDIDSLARLILDSLSDKSSKHVELPYTWESTVSVFLKMIDKEVLELKVGSDNREGGLS